MKKIRLLVGPVLVPVLVASAFIGTQTQVATSAPVGNRVLQRALAIERGEVTRAKWEMPLSSGVVYALLQATGDLDARAKAAPRGAAQPQVPSKAGRTQGCSNVFGTAAGPANIRVNQDCGRRRQAEEVVVENPTNPNNLIAGQNDSRNGFNQCGYDWTFDGGVTWGDQVPPFYQFLQLDNRTADACSDPTVTFDSVGNAYVGGILFNVAAAASSLVVAKSNAPHGGQFYHSPAPGPFQEYASVPLGVVANDNNPNVFHDKEFIVGDTTATSPKADNVYATWTRFDFDTGEGVGAHSPIYFSQSTDGGATWSPGIEISGRNPEVCTVFSGSEDPNACDQDQGSHPIVGPDGTVYVVFGNGNTPLPGINQVLFVKCPAAADCSQQASWTQPVKINDLIDNHPTGPDPNTGCPPGRQCLPPNGYRVPEFTSMTLSIDTSENLYVTWSDFRNGGPPCVGPAPSATPPCDNDVFYSFSIDGGATWSPEVNIAPASEVGVNAQWQPWSEVRADGERLYVAYYDRRYGDCEFTGCNDITLATITNPISGPSIGYRRITTSSMPNLVPANNPLQAGFLGDYMWVDVGASRVHIVWADTRGLNNTVEEDIYYAFVRA
jgi:hypothetical protein